MVYSYLNLHSVQSIKEVCSELLDAEASIHELFKNTKDSAVLLVS